MRVPFFYIIVFCVTKPKQAMKMYYKQSQGICKQTEVTGPKIVFRWSVTTLATDPCTRKLILLSYVSYVFGVINYRAVREIISIKKIMSYKDSW